MVWLEDKIEIKAAPERIFDWFSHLEENYLAWHPQDHIEWRTLKGDLMEEGSTFYFAERIGGRMLKMKCRITGVEPNRRVEWAAVGPFSLLGVRGIFLAEPMAGGSLFTAVVYFGSRVSLLGRVLDWATRTFLPHRLEAIRRHMAEEGQNLKRLLEGVMFTEREDVSFESEGDRLAATLFLPEEIPAPGIIFAHGVFEFKEDFFDYAGRLAASGFVALALDMRGHGASEGNRYGCDMRQWTADMVNAMDYLETLPEVERGCLGLVGLSSGGTAVLRAAARPDPRVKAVVTLAASIQTGLSAMERAVFIILGAAGLVKRTLTGSDLRVNLVSLANQMVTAENPEVDRHFHTAPRLVDAFQHVPFPGVWNGFIVDIRGELPRIQAPTLVIHGAQDQMEPSSGAHVLYNALTCEKELRIIEGSGHLLHLDYKKDEVFALLLDWFRRHLRSGPKERRCG